MRFPKVHRPTGSAGGEFVSLRMEEMRVAYATFVAALRGDDPPDEDFPGDYVDANTGETKPLRDTQSNRAWFATGKLFKDEAKQVSFYWRAQHVMPITNDKRYAKYTDPAAGWMHVALMLAVARVRGSDRTTKEALHAAFDAEFRRQLAKTVDPGEAAKRQ